MLFLCRVFCIGLVLVTLVAPDHAPRVNIDYQENLKLWRAQKSILAAFESIQEADRQSPHGLGSHASKASDLLVQAAQEVKLASLRSARP